ncbi:MAG: hypothetical protein SNJ54_06095 [Anaerolineae bacterium]
MPFLFRWQNAAAALLCALAFGLSLLVSDRVFEGLPHLEDEVAYLFQARVFAAGEWVIPSPPVRQAFTQPFIVDHAGSGEMRRFSKYPPGWSLLLAGGLAMGYGAWVNAAFAAAAVALVYRLGRIYNPHVGLIAALLLAFSPAALLLNGSLMAHSAALALACGFLWCVWNAEQTGRRWPWALAAGVLLGVLLLTRPAPAVAVALPVMVWLGGRIMASVSCGYGPRARFKRLQRRVLPYVGLALVALSLQAVNMAYNAAAVGDARANLYTLVWSYDRIGFGECCGRTGHTLEKAIRHVRFDMSLAAADLFGWQWGGWALGDDLPPDLREHLLTKATYWPPLGLSFVLLPFGVVIGAVSGRWRRVWGAAAWALAMSAWAVLPVVAFPLEMLRDPTFSWLWIILGLAMALAPALAVAQSASPTVTLTWLLVSFTACIVIFQMTYWVGAQRYSARYWYEAVGAVSILSALPLGASPLTPLSRREGTLSFFTPLLYAVLVVVVLCAHYAYSIPRVSVLHGFNNVSRAHVEALEARRDGRPALVLVTGPLTGDYRVTWRAFGTYTALTSPFLDSDVVVARIPEGDTQRREQVLALFPERQVIEMRALASEAWFVDQP